MQGYKSTTIPLTQGVPQGSVLGPFTFYLVRSDTWWRSCHRATLLLLEESLCSSSTRKGRTNVCKLERSRDQELLSIRAEAEIVHQICGTVCACTCFRRVR